MLINITLGYILIYWIHELHIPSLGIMGTASIASNAIGIWIFRIGLWYVLGIVFHMGILGIWIAMYVDWLVRGTMYSLRLRGSKWLMHRI